MARLSPLLIALACWTTFYALLAAGNSNAAYNNNNNNYQQQQRPGATGSTHPDCAGALQEAERAYLQCTEAVTSAPFDISKPQGSAAKLSAEVARCGTRYQDTINKLPCSSFKHIGKPRKTAMGAVEYAAWRKNNGGNTPGAGASSPTSSASAAAAGAAGVGAGAGAASSAGTTTTASSGGSRHHSHHHGHRGWRRGGGCGGCCLMKFFGFMFFSFWASKFLCCFCRKMRGARRRCHERWLRGVGGPCGMMGGPCGMMGGRCGPSSSNYRNFGSGHCRPASPARVVVGRVIDGDELLLQEALRVSAAEAAAAEAAAAAREPAPSAPTSDNSLSSSKDEVIEARARDLLAAARAQAQEVNKTTATEPAARPVAAASADNEPAVPVQATVVADDEAWQQVPAGLGGAGLGDASPTNP